MKSRIGSFALSAADSSAVVEPPTKAALQDLNDSQDDLKGGGTGGWLVALAKAFGKMADKVAAKLEKMGKKLFDKMPSEQWIYQAKAQKFSVGGKADARRRTRLEAVRLTNWLGVMGGSARRSS
jgi:hypothetical protein